MARKRKEAEMPATAPPKAKPVRLDLSEEDHYLLRLEAARAKMSMASYARSVLLRALKQEREKKEGR